MKSVISAAGILIFIIILVTVSYVYTDRIVTDMLGRIDKNEKFVAKNDWEQAENEINEIREIWQKSRKIFALIANHSLTEGIDESLAKIKYAVKLRKNDDFYLELGPAKLRVHNLLEHQELSLSNLF